LHDDSIAIIRLGEFSTSIWFRGPSFFAYLSQDAPMAFQPPTPADIDRAVKAWLAAGPPLTIGLRSAETFADIEQLTLRIGRAMACHLTEQALDQQADEMPDQTPCPTCGRHCRVTRHNRQLVTVAGVVSYHEPASHCESCRRDFFSGTDEAASG
jgi:hypothetical protein